MNLQADIVPSLLVALLYIALFAGAEIWSRIASPDVETTRKMVHFGGGIIALFFPVLFSSHWPVLILASLFTIILLITKRSSFLRSVQGVERTTIGEIIYPLAIYTVFLLATISGSYRNYAIAILILAMADAAAGIVGRRYGRHRYHVSGGSKSLEGSAAFFAVTFSIIIAGLLAGGAQPVPEIMAAAMLVALLLTGVEAVAPKGADNVTVPLGAWYLLSYVSDRRMPEMALDIGVLAALAAVTLWLALAKKVIGVAGAIIVALVVYGALVLAGCV